MTSGRSDDVERFAVARWPTLLRTAYLVTGSAADASRCAAETLDELDRGWSDALGEGAPSARARALLISRLLVEAPAVAVRAPAEWPAPGGGQGWDALLDAYGDLPVLARAALALEHLEGVVGTERVAALEGADVRACLAEARSALAAAQARAYAGSGLEPPDLDTELRDALSALAERGCPTGDPLPLLRQARATRRRRTRLRLLAGTGVVAVVSLVLALSGAASGGVADGVPGPTRSTPAALPVTAWPARGELADEPAVTGPALAQLGATTHLLYADDVGTTRMVVGWRPAQALGRIVISVLAGPAGTTPLLPDSEFDAAAAATSIVVVGPAADDKTPLLVLGPPGGDEAEISSHVSYRPDGIVDRIWSTMLTRNGVAFVQLLGNRLPALRVRMAGYDGPPGNLPVTPPTTIVSDCAACSARRWRTAVARVVTAQLSAATRVPATRITTTIVSAATVTEEDPGAVPSLFAGSSRVKEDVACQVHRLPDGATVVSMAVRVAGPGDPLTTVQLSVVPADTAPDRPCVLPRARTAGGDRTYVVAGAGASAVRVVPATLDPLTPGGYVAISAGAAVVTVAGTLADDRASLELVDATGRGITTWPFGDLLRVTDPLDLSDPVG